MRVPFRLDTILNEATCRRPERHLAADLHTQTETYVTFTTITRLVNTIEFRLGEPLDLIPAEIQEADWNEVAARMEERVRQALAVRQEKLLGSRRADTSRPWICPGAIV